MRGSIGLLWLRPQRRRHGNELFVRDPRVLAVAKPVEIRVRHACADITSLGL
jgi:hypothetical protein